MNERVRKLRGRIKPPARTQPPSSQTDRLLTLMNHRRAVLDHEDRKASAEAGGRLDVGEPPAPLPPPTLEDLRIDLDAALHFVSVYIPSQDGGGRSTENEAMLDEWERHTRDEIERLRMEIREKEGSTE